ncbi:MAG: hypothetical protein IT353_19120 [Gemmatimonadaceae bacterium]|nr:hypothetical protein [Gemmatimonadaceae bacterium]
MSTRSTLVAVVVALSTIVLPSSSSAQEQRRADHEGEIDCAIPRHALVASNSAVYQLKDVIISSYDLFGKGTGSSTKRCSYRPTNLRLTLPAGSPPKEFSLSSSTPGSTQVSGDTGTHELGAVVTLTHGTASCRARATMSISGQPAKLVMNIGDVSALFDASGKPVAAKCGAK